MPRLPLLASSFLLAAAALPARAGAPASRSVVLVTLDTTRADALGSYGAPRATPALDALAARGLRYARALSASPLTLPAHASLLTGLEPPEHGAVDNGTSVLAGDVPTLATLLAARGHACAAFVASRVLDRRFGLARGFEPYDDRMAAERTGEYGYPERDAASVTEAALAWLGRRPAGRPSSCGCTTTTRTRPTTATAPRPRSATPARCGRWTRPWAGSWRPCLGASKPPGGGGGRPRRGLRRARRARPRAPAARAGAARAPAAGRAGAARGTRGDGARRHAPGGRHPAAAGDGLRRAARGRACPVSTRGPPRPRRRPSSARPACRPAPTAGARCAP